MVPFCTLILAAALCVQGADPAAQPSAFALLEEVRDRYSALATYADAGHIELSDATGEERRFEFETYFDFERGLSLTLRGDGGTESLYQLANEQRLRYDSSGGAPVPIESLRQEIRAILGQGGVFGLAHVLLLDTGLDLLSDPQAASVEDRVDCAPGSCWVVSSTVLEGAIHQRLWVDVESRLLTRVEIESEALQSTLATAMANAGLKPVGKRKDASRRLAVVFERAVADPGVDCFPAPPAVASVTGSGAIAWKPKKHEDERPLSPLAYREQIDVRLSTIAVRAVDSGGRRIAALDVSDFGVDVGGREVKIRSVRWVSSESEAMTLAEMEELARYGLSVEAPGKLVVFFVQTDLNPARAPGLLRLAFETDQILDSLHRDDRVAVVSFESHLTLRLDFTRSREEARRALLAALRRKRTREVEPGRFPSMARHLDPREALRAASPERGLELVGRALQPFEGRKVMIYVGWGLGRYGAGGVRMTPEYEPAKRALRRAGVSVSVLDITRADSHSLEIGLEMVARETGGVYEKTFHNPRVAVERVMQMIAGYYEITFEPPSDLESAERVRVRLRGRHGEVHYEHKRVGPI